MQTNFWIEYNVGVEKYAYGGIGNCGMINMVVDDGIWREKVTRNNLIDWQWMIFLFNFTFKRENLTIRIEISCHC